MAFTGMDTAVVQEIGNRLKVQATEVGSVIASIDRLVSTLTTCWDGHDAQEFRNWWQTQHRPALHQAQERLDGLGQSALHNVSEQEGASGGGVGSASAGVAGGSVAAAGAAAAGAAAAGSAAAGAGSQRTQPSGTSGGATGSSAGAGSARPAVDKFVGQYNGKGLDFDGKYGNQCVDLFEYYNRDVVGAPPIHMSVSGGARDLFEAQPGATTQYYDRISYSAGMVPQPGDVAVWGATTNNDFGHVAVVTGASSSSFDVIQQNGFRPSDPAYQGSYGYNSLGGSLLGFLRPKKFA